MKLKYKLLLDVVMAMVLCAIMQYQLTGGLIHEIIGFLLIGGFILHLIFQRKYIGAIHKILKNENHRFQNIMKLLLNVLLLLCMLLMFISSICISRDLLYQINAHIPNYMVWRTIHVIAAYGMVLSIIGHVAFHADMIVNYIRKIFHVKEREGLWKGTSRVLALLLAVFVLKSTIEQVTESVNLLKSSRNKSYISEYVYNSSGDDILGLAGENTLQETETSSEEETGLDVQNSGSKESESSTLQNQQTETQVSQEEYLSKLFCTGCSKHCCLLAPQCSKGRVQQSNAIEAYKEM